MAPRTNDEETGGRTARTAGSGTPPAGAGPAPRPDAGTAPDEPRGAAGAEERVAAVRRAGIYTRYLNPLPTPAALTPS
ncbi:ROK family transcriptional regulator, partial [Streptomyces sp. NPDC001675]